MAGKTGKTVSLEAIEEHLKRQDKEIAKSHVVTFAFFGATVALVAFSAWLARIPDITIRDYAFPIILGLAAMGIALYWVSRIDRIKVEKPLNELDKKSEKKMNLSPWLYFATAIGFPVFLAGWVGFVEVLIKSNPNITAGCWYLSFVVVMVIGLAAILPGVYMAVKVSWRNSMIEKK